MGIERDEAAPGIRLSLLCDVEDASGRTARIPVSLSHRADDPLAVVVTLGQGDEAVTWVFSVELLEQGQHALTGNGSVRVWPSAVMQDRPEVTLLLESGTRSATVRLPGAALQLFLVSVADVRNQGILDRLVDAELNSLFGGR